MPDQSAAVPYRTGPRGPEVLLVTSRSRERWIVPKGNVEASLGARGTAEQEAFEEAGVVGNADDEAFGRYRHDTEEGSYLVEVFLLEVEDVLPRWPEDHERRRRWVPVHEAPRHVDVEGLRPLLHRAVSKAEERVVQLERELEGLHAADPEREAEWRLFGYDILLASPESGRGER